MSEAVTSPLSKLRTVLRSSNKKMATRLVSVPVQDTKSLPRMLLSRAEQDAMPLFCEWIGTFVICWCFVGSILLFTCLFLCFQNRFSGNSVPTAAMLGAIASSHCLVVFHYRGGPCIFRKRVESVVEANYVLPQNCTGAL